MGFKGFLKKLVGGSNEQVSGGETGNNINIGKGREGIGRSGINLEKSIISLDKTLVNLTKKSGINLEKHMAKVAVVMDYSGSMAKLYKRGAVQDVLTRLIPLALKFDDNGELEVWLFNDGFARVEPMTINNYENYVNKEIRTLRFDMGGTYYEPVLRDILHKYFIEEADTSNIPTFLIFITDGENFDPNQTDRVIIESSHKNIFIQFVGIGKEDFKYLQKLDDLPGRPVDNTGFIKVDDISQWNDEQLYSLLLDQYPDWLKNKPI